MKTRWRTQKIRFILFTTILLSLILGIYGYVVFFTPQQLDNSGDNTSSVTQKKISNSAGSSAKTTIKRRKIYDLNLKELALSFLIASVYVKPLELNNSQSAIEKLSTVLEIDKRKLTNKVASEKSFIWVARNVPQVQAEKIRQFHLAGVYLTKEEVRLYPNGRQGGHILGFAKGQQGLAGVESYYDSVLNGTAEFAGHNLKIAGISGAEILNGTGASLILSLDLRIQAYLEKNLATLLKTAAARSAMAIIMVPGSGEILAMANSPDYDPNFFWRAADFQRRNRAVSDPIRVGGLLEAFRMSAELEGGNIPDFILNAAEIAKIVIEPRRYKRVVGATLRRQANSYWQELPDGVYWSAPEKDFSYRLTPDELALFSRRYGFKGMLPIDLPSSLPISASNNSAEFSLTDWRSTTTTLRLVTAFSRLLNGGKQVTPHILKAVWLEEQGQKIAAHFATDKNAINLAAKKNVLRLFNELTPKSFNKGIYLEALTPERGEEGKEHVELSNTSAEEVAGTVEDMMPVKIRYSDVVLGAVPAQKPEIALVLVLDGAVFDQNSASINQKEVENILTRALVWRKIVKTNDTPDDRFQEKELFSLWRELHNDKEKIGLTPKSQRRKMPKVRGLSLRRALQLLQNYDLRIRVVGSGGVVVQHPRAGEYLAEGADCFLELAFEQ